VCFDTAQEMGVLLQVELVNQLIDVVAQPARRTGQHERGSQLVVVTQPPVGLQESADILARLDRGDEQDILVRHAVQGLHPCQRLILGHGAHARIRGLVDHGDAVFGRAQHAHQVVLGAVRDGDDVIRLPHRTVDLAVVPGAILGHKVRVDQESQVVDRDDAAAAMSQGRNEIGTVKYVCIEPAHNPRHQELFQPVMTRDARIGHIDIGSTDEMVGLAAILEQSKVFLRVSIGQRLRQPERILPDAGTGIIDQPCVDSYMHAGRPPAHLL